MQKALTFCLDVLKLPVYMATRGHPECPRLQEWGQFAAWLGLTPRQYSSRGKTKLGRISRRGDACLRSLLLQGTRSTLQSALRKPPALLNRLQQWVIRLYGRVGYHKTLIAIANKHARQLWALLVKGKTYDLNAWQRYCTGKMTPTEARYNQVQPTATCSEAPQVRPTSCDPG